MEARKLVGWNLRRLRVAKGLTIEDLADKARVGASYLSRLERGEENVSVLTLAKLVRAVSAKLADVVVEPGLGEKAPKPMPAGRKRTRPRRPRAVS